MAQAGYTPISLYYSTTSTQEPAAADLVSGELAINIADGKLFYKNSGGNVRLLSIGYGSSTVTPTNGGVQYGTGTALALTAAGSSGQILRSNGAAAPTWADLSTLGVNTISFGTTGLTPNSATAGAVTVAGTLATTNGGTGLTSFTANGVVYASSSSVLTTGSALTFDGTNFQVNGSVTATSGNMVVAAGKGVAFAGDQTRIFTPEDNVSGGLLQWGALGVLRFNAGASSELMRLDSTGLGIGTSSPGQKAVINGGLAVVGAATLSAAQGAGLMSFESPIMRCYVGDGTGYSWAFSKRAASVTTDLMTLNDSGNLGLGTTSPAFRSDTRIPSAGAIANFSDGTQNLIIGTASGNVGYVNGESGVLGLYTGGTERARITSGGDFQTSSGGSVQVGGTAARATTAGTNRLDIFDGTAPVGTLANGVSFYSTAGEARVMDAAGNATLLSPHDTETNEWIFHSKHTPTGKVLRIDVERLLKFVNDHFGLDAVQEFIEP